VNKIKSLSSVATMAVAMGLVSWGGTLHAQTAPSTPSDQQTPQTQPTPSPEMPPQSQQTPTSQAPDTQAPPSTQSPSTQAPSQAPDASQAPDTTTPDSAKPNSQAGAPGATATGTDTQTFSGTVSKQGDKYVLKDDTGQTYDIDHQTEVAKFDGKRVRVQGTLDPTGKKIMVK
jgi:outer membrane biosynthesis protein TonB